MTDTPNPNAVRARLAAAEAERAIAAGELAKLERPSLQAALEALQTPRIRDLEASLDQVRGEISHVLAGQALANVPMILAATRRQLEAAIAEHDRAIAQAAAAAADE